MRPRDTVRDVKWWGIEDDDARRQHFVLGDYDHTAFPRGTRVIDVGCGTGEQLQSLAAQGCVAVGVDVALPPEAAAQPRGVHLVLARAEHLPFRPGTFDGAVTKVVLPYTDETRAVREIGRVLRNGGTWKVTGHGLGYYLDYLLLSPSFKRRVYALRTIGNTVLYRMTGARWVLGDSIYQSLACLTRHCAHAGFRITRLTPAPRFLGLPVFLYLRLIVSPAPAASHGNRQRHVA